MKRLGVGGILVLLSAACGDDSTPSNIQNTNNSTASGTNNVTNNQTNSATNNATNVTNNATNGGTNNATNNATNNQTVCEPLDACPADICGMVADGCGGFLDCGVCPCVDGVPTEVACGACDLGLSVCAPNETGFGTCEMPIPGITDLTCEDIVFVRGGGVGDGSKASPLNDVQAAIAQAGTSDKHLVVIGGSTTMSMNGPLDVVEGIHVIGGFDDTFLPSPMEQPVLSNTLATSPNVFAGRAIDVVGATHLKNLKLTTADATTPGANTYGLWALRANGLVLTNVTLAPGLPGDGVAGTAGTSSIDGQNGFPGRDGNYRTNEGQSYPLQTNTVIGGLGCGGSPRAGGAGGRGAGYSSASNPSTLLTATTGGVAPGLPGGLAGSNYTSLNMGTSGGHGLPGVSGAIIIEGTGGSGVGTMDSTLFFVRAADGGEGGLGEHGWGGAGGGGAGAFNINTGGPSGGSGGGGGCGGIGGTGGTQGGSSFGLVLQSSAGFLYTDLVLEPAAGAAGGGGGEGGTPGLGGLGGKGGDTLVSPNATKASTLLGGDGGKGGDGARGGHGGGGAGGHSIAVWCDGTYNYNQMTMTPSPGGAGGPSLGLAGETGMSRQEYGCTL